MGSLLEEHRSDATGGRLPRVNPLGGERRQDAVALDHDRLPGVDVVGDDDLEGAAHVARYVSESAQRLVERD